jgi:hypothetical protein
LNLLGAEVDVRLLTSLPNMLSGLLCGSYKELFSDFVSIIKYGEKKTGFHNEALLEEKRSRDVDTTLRWNSILEIAVAETIDDLWNEKFKYHQEHNLPFEDTNRHKFSESEIDWEAIAKVLNEMIGPGPIMTAENVRSRWSTYLKFQYIPESLLEEFAEEDCGVNATSTATCSWVPSWAPDKVFFYRNKFGGFETSKKNTGLGVARPSRVLPDTIYWRTLKAMQNFCFRYFPSLQWMSFYAICCCYGCIAFIFSDYLDILDAL